MELKIINELLFTSKEKLIESGGGTLWRVNYNKKEYVYKEIKIGKTLDDFVINYNSHKKEYYNMTKYNNLACPLYLVNNKSNEICGYLMNFLNGYNTLNSQILEITNSNIEINEINFMKIFNGVINCFINIYNSGLTPCPEHGDNIMLDANYNVVMIDLDDIIKCKQNSAIDTIKQLNTIFINIHPNFYINDAFKTFFKIKNRDIVIKEDSFSNIEDIKYQIYTYVNSKTYLKLVPMLNNVKDELINYIIILLSKESNLLSNNNKTNKDEYTRLITSIIALI
jgi:hypothetical protein